MQKPGGRFAYFLTAVELVPGGSVTKNLFTDADLFGNKLGPLGAIKVDPISAVFQQVAGNPPNAAADAGKVKVDPVYTPATPGAVLTGYTVTVKNDGAVAVQGWLYIDVPNHANMGI